MSVCEGGDGLLFFFYIDQTMNQEKERKVGPNHSFLMPIFSFLFELKSILMGI